jgi:hypothetical protein
MGGTQQWSKAVGVSGRYTTIRSIAFNAQNNFFITGSCRIRKKSPDLAFPDVQGTHGGSSTGRFCLTSPTPVTRAEGPLPRASLHPGDLTSGMGRFLAFYNSTGTLLWTRLFGAVP